VIAAPAGAAPIGVFDSGAGGLSVVAAIRAALPGRPIVYFADTAYAPYGDRRDGEIVERTESACHWLLALDVAAVVIACNTATAVAIDQLRTWSPVPVIGVEPGLKPAASVTRNGSVGVLATAATLASRRYRELAARIAATAPRVRWIGHAARDWVELVEAGDLGSDRAHARVAAAVSPLLEQGADTLVLGCTHYPFLREAIERIAAGVPLIETGPAVARELARRLDDVAAGGGRDGPAAPPLRLATTGEPGRLAALAWRLLQVDAPAVAV
jgi:glutamate racemase